MQLTTKQRSSLHVQRGLSHEVKHFDYHILETVTRTVTPALML